MIHGNERIYMNVITVTCQCSISFWKMDWLIIFIYCALANLENIAEVGNLDIYLRGYVYYFQMP